MAGQPFTVAGIAVTAAIVPYPSICYSGCHVPPSVHEQGISAKQIGLIWTTEADMTKLASAMGPVNNLCVPRMSSISCELDFDD
ncbi:MAG: hypothetical protein M0Z42_16745 [Actinomycetota bacterium]|nr:hypothetical protein [Actinomycetota bacterium]